MSIFNLLPLKTAEYWLRLWCHLSASYFEGGAFWWFITIFYFSSDNSFCILMIFFHQIIWHVYIYIYIYIYVWNHCEYSDHAIQAIILSHLWLKWTNMQIRFFFPRYIVLFVILCDGCFFTAEKKGINNKLFQILGGVYTSLQNRRFTSQARRTRHFARSVRRGEEKNKAAVTSPLFWLLLCRLSLY